MLGELEDYELLEEVGPPSVVLSRCSEDLLIFRSLTPTYLAL